MIVYVVCCLLLWNAAEAQTTTSQLLTPVILTCTGTIDPSANQSASLTTQMAGLLGVTADRVAGLQISFGELYDQDTYLMLDIFQLSFNLSTDDAIKLGNLVASKKLKLVDLNNNSLAIPVPQDLNGRILNYGMNVNQYPGNKVSYDGFFSFSCLVPVLNLSKNDLLAKVVASGRCKDLLSCYFNTSTMITKLYDSVNFTICNRTRLWHIYRYNTILNEYNEVSLIGDSQVEHCFRNQLVNSLTYSSNNIANIFTIPLKLNGKVNGRMIVWTGTLLRLVIVDVLHFGESKTDSIVWKFRLNSLDCNGTRLWVPTQTTNAPFPTKLVVQTLSFSVIGNFDDITGYSESNFAQTLFSQLSTVMNLNATYFSDYQSKILQSGMAANIYFNISSFFQDKVTDITAANSTFFNLLNGNQLNLVDVQNKPLNISTCSPLIYDCTLPYKSTTTTSTSKPTTTISTSATVATIIYQIVILGNYDANSAPLLSQSLSSQLRTFLNVSSDALAIIDLIGGDLCDPVTFICTPIVKFSFSLTMFTILEEASDVQSLVVNYNFALYCSPRVLCKVPLNQDLKSGSLTWEIVGKPLLIDYYFDLTGGKSFFDACTFSLACNHPTTVQLVQTMKNQLQTDHNIFHLNLSATNVETNTNCNRKQIYIYAFKLTILNNYDVIASNTTRQQVVSLLQIPDGNFLFDSVEPIDLVGDLNGRKTTLLRRVTQYTFNVMTVGNSSTEALVTNIMRYYESKQWLLVDSNGAPLTIPDQYCRGTLKVALAVQTLSYAILSNYSNLLVNNDADQLASVMKTYISKQLNISKDCFGSYSYDQLINGATAFNLNMSSYTRNGIVDITEANKTFNQLLSNGSLQLYDSQSERLPVSNLDGQFTLKTFEIFVFAEWVPENETAFVAKLVGDLADSLNVPANYLDATIVPGEIYDVTTIISASLIRMSLNFTLNFTSADDQVSNLHQLHSTNALRLTDLINNPLAVPIEQDLQGNFLHPVAIKPFVEAQINRARIRISCHQLNSADYDIDSLANYLESNFEDILDLNSLTFSSTDSSVSIDDSCSDTFAFIESVKLTIFNDFDSTVGSDYCEFASFLKEQLITESGGDYIQALNVAQVNYVGYIDDKVSVLFTNIIQASFRRLSRQVGAQPVNDQVSFVSEAKQWSYNEIRLIIPLEFKNGSTINVLEYRTAPMKVMVKYDKFVTDSDLISRLINQLTDGNKLNISNMFFLNHSFVRMPDNYTGFLLNVSSYCNETVIDIHSRISKYLTSLKSLKVAIKNKNNYPIHILPIDDKHKFLILPAYDDQDLIPNLAVAALVILILSVIKIELCARIKSWQQNALRKRARVYPTGQDGNVAGPSGSNMREMSSLEQARVQLESVGLIVNQLKDFLNQTDVKKSVGVYNVNVKEAALSKSVVVAEKAFYDAPI